MQSKLNLNTKKSPPGEPEELFGFVIKTNKNSI
jgi:hypothetical protein